MMLHAPAAERNKVPITEVLRGIVPETGLVLEIASGSGQHVVHFARVFPAVTWRPSDMSAEAVTSIDSWVADAGVTNVLPALRLNVQDLSWPRLDPMGLLNLNMIHIAPWAACEGLFRHAEALGVAWVFLYGPFFVDGVDTSPSNLAFDASLRQRDPAWGVRRLEDVAAVARARGLNLERFETMPANNLSVLFRRA